MAISNVEVEVKAVSDPFMDLKLMAYQVKYNSVRNKFPGTIAMPITICINGFGRIGRLAFRAAIANLEVMVKAKGDPFMDLKFTPYQFSVRSSST